jgi:hypothetical protein
MDRPEIGSIPTIRLEHKILEKMKCYCKVKENLWKPPVRFGASLTNCGGRVYMFGGYSN